MHDIAVSAKMAAGWKKFLYQDMIGGSSEHFGIENQHERGIRIIQSLWPEI